MSILYILIGLPGSRKSTWAKEKAKDENVIIIERDSFRSMIKGGDYTFDKKYEMVIKKCAFGLTFDSIVNGFDVIVDGCHITKKHREEIVNYVKCMGHVDVTTIGIWFTEEENNLKNRMMNPRGCSEEKWDKIINDMKDSFEKPDESEFDELITIPRATYY